MASALARAILAGDAAEEPIVGRCAAALGRRWRWLRPLVRRYLAAFGAGQLPLRAHVAAFLLQDPGFARACALYAAELAVTGWRGLLEAPRRMQPAAAAAAWPVPQLVTLSALADWLGLSQTELEWFADLKGLNSPGKLNHYRYRLLTKKSGGLRLIEAPKPRLKQLQRTILREILELVPVHDAAHGFRKGRSTRSFAAPHVARPVILKMDLEDFFPSIAAGRIAAFFRTAGYPEAVAARLAGICANSAPPGLWRDVPSRFDPIELHRTAAMYARPHLPQGAPTSPALANLCAYRADCRLSGLAKSVGAEYTRYADDLAFSGDKRFGRAAESFAARAAAILIEEGFSIKFRKTRVMRQGVRQYLAGLAVNQRLNIVREDFDRLKAILTNCARHGPQGQNRDAHPGFRAHLEGRVAYLETVNPAKGNRLRGILDRIRW